MNFIHTVRSVGSHDERRGGYSANMYGDRSLFVPWNGNAKAVVRVRIAVCANTATRSLPLGRIAGLPRLITSAFHCVMALLPTLGARLALSWT